MNNAKLQQSHFLRLYEDLEDEEYNREMYIKKNKLSRSAKM